MSVSSHCLLALALWSLLAVSAHRKLLTVNTEGMHACYWKKTTRKTALGKWWICSLLHVHSFLAQPLTKYRVWNFVFKGNWYRLWSYSLFHVSFGMCSRREVCCASYCKEQNNIKTSKHSSSHRRAGSWGMSQVTQLSLKQCEDQRGDSQVPRYVSSLPCPPLGRQTL